MQQIFSNMFAVVGLLYPYQYHRNMTMFGPTRTLLIDSYAIHLSCILSPRTVLSQALQLYISLAYQGERTHLLSHWMYTHNTIIFYCTTYIEKLTWKIDSGLGRYLRYYLLYYQGLTSYISIGARGTFLYKVVLSRLARLSVVFSFMVLHLWSSIFSDSGFRAR